MKDIKKLWKIIYQREAYQAIRDKNWADKALKQFTIQIVDLVMLNTRHLVLKAVTGKLNQDSYDHFELRHKWEPIPSNQPYQLQSEFIPYSMSHFYDATKESVNPQDLLR